MQYFTLLTVKGAEKIAAATAANTTVDLTHIALGDGNGSVVIPDASKTALVNEVYRASLNDLRVDANNANWVVAESNVPASQGNFWVREVGVFDTDGDLIAIGNYPETFKPVTADGVAKDLYMKVIFEVSSSDAVTLQVDPSVVMASQEFVNNEMAKKSDVNHNHDTAYAAINGDSNKKFKVGNPETNKDAVNKEHLESVALISIDKDFNGDVNDIKKEGNYSINQSASNLPAVGYFSLIAFGAATVLTQMFVERTSGEIYLRSWNGLAWTAYKKMASGSINDMTKTDKSSQRANNVTYTTGSKWRYIEVTYPSSSTAQNIRLYLNSKRSMYHYEPAGGNSRMFSMFIPPNTEYKIIDNYAPIKWEEWE